MHYDVMTEKQAYAKATNGRPGAAWHVCGCHRCPYAFAECDGSAETSVDWRLLRAARSAFKAVNSVTIRSIYADSGANHG